MDHKLILSNVSKHIQLDSSELDYFLSLLTSRDLGKKELILRQGASCDYIYFVNQGTLRAYHIDDRGKEYTIMFAISDWWITDMNGFLNEVPSEVNIEALQDSSIFQLSLSQSKELYIKVPKFERFMRILMQNAYVKEQQRGLANLSLSSEKRYRQILENIHKKSLRYH